MAYAAFEPFPNAKGSGTRIAQMLRALGEAGAQVRLFTLPGRHSRVPAFEGVEHRPLALAEPNFLRRGERFRERLLRELISFKPDVIHYRGLFEAEAARAYAARRSVRQVFEVNGLFSIELGYHYPRVLEAPQFQGRLRAREARALMDADLVLTQSLATESYLQGRVPGGLERVWVIPNGAEPSDYPEPARMRRERPRLFYAGTLASWQGVSQLLMATRRVLRQRPVRLALAGPVRRRWQRQLERTLVKLRLDDSVELLGTLERCQLAAEIAASDVCLAPLRRDARNLRQGSSPIKLFEYMAAGRPVISTDMPCVREIVTPDDTGLLATSARPSVLSASILELIDAPEFAEGLGRRARRHIADTATWQRRRAALAVAYGESVLGTGPAWNT